MKIILPPIIAIVSILMVSIFINYFPIGAEWAKLEADFDLLSPLFLIRNGILIILGILLTFMFSGGFGSIDEERKPDTKFLLPMVMGIAGAGIFILLLKTNLIWYPKGQWYTIIPFVLIWVLADELFFRSFLTKSIIKASSPSGTNIIALIISTLIYTFWTVTYYPIITQYNFLEILKISVFFLFALALPVTASYYYTRSLISSTITHLIIRGGLLAYTMIIIFS